MKKLIRQHKVIIQIIIRSTREVAYITKLFFEG